MSMASIKLVGILSLHMSTAFVDAEVEEEESRGLGFPFSRSGQFDAMK